MKVGPTPATVPYAGSYCFTVSVQAVTTRQPLRPSALIAVLHPSLLVTMQHRQNRSKLIHSHRKPVLFSLETFL